MNLIIALVLLSSMIFITAAKREPISLDSLCIFSSQDDVCYVDKEKDKFKTKKEIDKNYCIDETDLRKITSRLEQEQSK